MFIVYDKENVEYTSDYAWSNKKELKEVTVYSVRDDENGLPEFLIYEDNQWKYVSAKRFTTNK